MPTNANQPWNGMQSGSFERSESEGHVKDWFRTFDSDELDDVWVTEEFHPVPIMDTLLALLTIDEGDLDRFADEDEE
ncbi:MAG: hypothetical protein IT422_15845 [Pirellulaceae bacterium]|nr:hypothetical protein [Pirellulaceae bacterium]